MMRLLNSRTSRFVLLIGLALLVASTGTAQPQKATRISEYAPVKDLLAQVEFFVGRISSDLEDESEYGKDESARVALDASTLAVLAQILGAHDKDNPLRGASPKLVEAAVSLAEDSEEYEAAVKDLRAIKQAMSLPNKKEKIELEPVAELVLLMQQVPNINAMLQRGVNGRRFSRSADKNAGYAASMAALAQASLIDTSYCGDETDEEKWRKVCVEMRTAAADVNKAVRVNDQDAAKAAVARLAKTCDSCHHDFRD